MAKFISKPLSISEEITIAFHMLKFFGTKYNKEIVRELGLSCKDNEFVKFTVNQFLKWLEFKQVFATPVLYMEQVLGLAERLERVNVLTLVGGLYIEKRYICMPNLSSHQKASIIWLLAKLGPAHLIAACHEQIYALIGTTKDGDPAIGSGILVSENEILTCAHVLNDMSLSHVESFSGENVEVLQQHPHPEVDVGIVTLRQNRTYDSGLGFVNPEMLKEVVTIGYPRIPQSRDNIQVVQRGEIVQANYINCFNEELFLFSAIARPGNSGGPVISVDGSVCGIVARDLPKDDTDQHPFFAGIPTSVIVKALSEIPTRTKLTIPD